MEQIKSALEIALEKTAHLARASDEEIRRKKVEELSILANGVVQKYLRGESKLKDLSNASTRHQDRDLMSRAVWEQLVAAIVLEKCDNVLEGLEFLASDKEDIKKVTAKARKISEEFYLEKDKQLSVMTAKMEQSVRQELAQQGISGSSIEIVMESTPQWQQSFHELEAFFQSKLELVKESLNQLAPVNHNSSPERHK
jgi:hypothetical protein